MLHYVLRNLAQGRLRRRGAAPARPGRSRRLDWPAARGRRSSEGRTASPKDPMRLLLPLLAAAAAARPARGRRRRRAPVVLELFTSQGCSSCPPADALLDRARRPRRGDRAGAARRLLGLSRLEGRLRPARQHTARQRAYAKAARSRSIFTPEMVVQGEERLKGHDAAAHHGGDRAPAGAAGAGRAEPGARRRRACRSTSRPTGAGRARAGRRLPRALHPVRGAWRSRAARTPAATITYTNIVTDWETIGRWDGAAPIDLRHEGAGGRPAGGHRPAHATWGRC